MSRRIANALFALLTFGVLLLSAISICAQVTGGRISGTVSDSNAALVPNATITLKAQATGQLVSTQTNESGAYNFPNVAVGDYTVTVTAAGFQTNTNEVKVFLNQTTPLNVTLTVGGLQEAVNITVAAEPAIQTESSQQSQSFNSAQVQQLPLFNDLSLLARLSPNVASQSAGLHGNGGIVGGVRPHANSFTLDGVDNNDPVSTGPAVKVILEAVDQFTLLRNNFNAEFGDGAAGQFNTVTKAGTNDFHGNAFLFLQSQRFNAASSFEEQQLKSGEIAKLPFSKEDRYGFTAGGPILKNKLFFFGAFQRTFANQASKPSQYFAPTAAGLNQIAGLPGVSPYSGETSERQADPGATGKRQCHPELWNRSGSIGDSVRQCDSGGAFLER